MERRKSPLSLRIGKKLYRAGYRKLPALVLKPALKMGRLNRVMTYPVANGIEIDVPISMNLWDDIDVKQYEQALLDQFSEKVNLLPGEAVFIDSGADIGIVSMHIASRCPNVKRIEAFEPNPTSFPFLQINIDRLSIDAKCQNRAVSNFTGKGRLDSPDYDSTSHARYIVEDENGSIDVARIDDAVRDAGDYVALKIDVEGGERDAIDGALRVLRNAKEFVVVFEAHRLVTGRTKIDPTEIVRLLCTVAECDVMVSELPALELDPERNFFDQVTKGDIFNIVVSTLGTRKAQSAEVA